MSDRAQPNQDKCWPNPPLPTPLFNFSNILCHRLVKVGLNKCSAACLLHNCWKKPVKVYAGKKHFARKHSRSPGAAPRCESQVIANFFSYFSFCRCYPFQNLWNEVLCLCYVWVSLHLIFSSCYWRFSLGWHSGEQGYAAFWWSGYFILLAWTYFILLAT
jgi:hypothetical protein